MPSKPSSISSLSWSISCSCSNPLLLKPHNWLLTPETLILSCSQLRSSSPVLKHPPLAFPPPSWPQPREAAPGEPSSNQAAAHPSYAVQTTTPECHVSLPVASASVAPLQEWPSPFPSLHTWPLWTTPLSLESPQAVSSTSHQQLALTASQPPALVPASIHSKVQCGEYINLSE